MKTIAILDTETTSLDPNTGYCIEVAVVLYSVEHAAPIASFASLIERVSNAAEDVNRIPVALLASGVCPVSAKVWPMVGRMISQAEAVIAHRADFDRSFVDASVRDLRPWACSKYDIEWPKGKTGDGLVHLALSHGLGVVNSHRALTDCDILTRLFMRVAEMGYDVPEMLARAMLPRVSVLSLAPFAEKDIVKSHGFEWNGERREWTKRCIRGEVPEFPFKTAVIEC